MSDPYEVKRKRKLKSDISFTEKPCSGGKVLIPLLFWSATGEKRAETQVPKNVKGTERCKTVAAVVVAHPVTFPCVILHLICINVATR